jgi:hypothetical protein
MSSEEHSTDLSIAIFAEEHTVRWFVDADGVTWWVAQDVCNQLLRLKSRSFHTTPGGSACSSPVTQGNVSPGLRHEEEPRACGTNIRAMNRAYFTHQRVAWWNAQYAVKEQ